MNLNKSEASRCKGIMALVKFVTLEAYAKELRIGSSVGASEGPPLLGARLPRKHTIGNGL